MKIQKIFSSIFNLFKPETKIISEQSYLRLECNEAFKEGKKLFLERQDEEALKFFDKTIEISHIIATGFEDEVYSLRGMSLQNLKFHLDAIEDFNKAIERTPGDANLYFLRSLSKNSVGDLAGSISDCESAIKFIENDNKKHRGYNLEAEEQGYDSASEFYFHHLAMLKIRFNSSIEQHSKKKINKKRRPN